MTLISPLPQNLIADQAVFGGGFLLLLLIIVVVVLLLR